MKRVLVIAACAVTSASLMAAAPAFGGTKASHAPQASVGVLSTTSIHFGKCPASYADLKGTTVKCAALSVPENYSKPGGKKIKVEVSVLPHTSSAADYKGALLTNPGGPGGPGLDLPYYIEPAVPDGVGGDYDWIGFDPRGVGSSKPSLECRKDYFKGPRENYVPTSSKILSYWEKRSKRYAAACETKYGSLLKNMTTEDSARDMNSIRKALGVNKISYFGYSYGTYLGQVFSTLFPKHLKYEVLDSNVDPRGVWAQDNYDQDIAFDRNINIYFKWVAKYHKVYHLGKSGSAVSKAYYAEYAKLLKNPKGQLGPDEFNDVMLYAGYYESTWELITKAWSLLDTHHAGDITNLYKEFDGVGDDNEFAVYNAVQCSDAAWPDQATALEQNTKIDERAPFETWNNAWFNGPCAYWPIAPRTPLTINGSKVSSALLIDETDDAATPYPGSLEVRKLFPHSSLIAEPGGTTHADSLSGDACVDDLIAAYLKTGSRPARQKWNGPDYLCRPLPRPNPTKGAKPSIAKKSQSRMSFGSTLADLQLLRRFAR